jgi:SAM-dependent methyltransferase
VPAGEPGDARETTPAEPDLGRFLGEPTRGLDDWRWLWAGDRRFPISSHRGVFGRLIVAVKRFLRPLVAAPQADLWERQRVFNLILLEYLRRAEDVRAVVLDVHEHRLNHLEAVWRDGLAEVMAHNDALFARVDQKLDYVRRESRSVWARLASAVAAAEGGGPGALARVREEQDYLDLERRFRGTEEEIADRLRPYLPYLSGRGEVLDLGCGRGEALAILAERGVVARGVDASSSMVEECRRKGLSAEVGDLFEALAGAREGSLGGVVSFHVIEHLPPGAVERLVRLAWRALAPGGVLILETPNPLSLVVAARNFWLDPTHRRPVHPDTLRLLFQVAGFEPVERIDLRPFPVEQRLPELALDGMADELRPLAHSVNELRDRIDDLLWGFQDYALIGTKPGGK